MKCYLIFIALFISSSVALDCQQVDGRLKQIDVSLGQVFGVNSNDNIYTRYGSTWVQLPGALKHITIGPAGVWGVNKDNQIYKIVAGQWVNVPGLLKQIDAGGDEFVSGANMVDGIFCMGRQATMAFRNAQTPTAWEQLPGALKYYSCGPNGCWGVNSANQIFIMKGVTPTACKGSQQWQNIPGSLAMIEVGTDGSVYGVNADGNVFRRDGITARNPAGTGWTHITISGACQHVSYDLGQLWVIKNDGSIWTCS
ncbi:fish-egg lectin-like isoform X2 [Erpetoichthys calabaricus]|uniref:fish-egg lectin-like isoform X2 n=1 Tax=Erpetoichthys calabaricus TaxID=27687 RepID=UPI002234B216|nr:fish-egg lectin-like isoform X2 [Erpetoichthys calabaricus]